MTARWKTILIVEDEHLIRMAAAEFLTDAGHNVVEAEHADAALGILQARAAEIRLLFTDIQMPGAMSGLELAHHARSHWPWIALLVTSGACNPRAEDMPVRSRFLRKPYAAAHVVAHAQELMAA